MVDDLLTMSQLEAGVLRLEPERVALADVLSNVHAHLGPLVSKHKLCIDLPHDLPMVMADPYRVVQVVSNLVSNAIKFSDVGTTVNVGARLHDDQIMVQADKGKGIPTDQLKRVFEPFYRAEEAPSDQHKGFGLGLSICRKLVEAHGVQIWVESVVDRGSTFSFSLPQAC